MPLGLARLVDVIDWGLHYERALFVARPQGPLLKELVESSRPLGELCTAKDSSTRW